VRVAEERTLERRLFQIAGAAERKPRAPNEIQRVTETRLFLVARPIVSKKIYENLSIIL